NARDFHGRRRQLLGPASGQASLEVGELLLELLLLVEELLQALRQLERRDLEEARRLAERGLLLPDVAERVLARHRLDAPDAGRHRAFVHDLEEPDLAGGVQVNPAAQL